MTVNGISKLVSPFFSEDNIKNYSGKKVAIDTNSLIYKLKYKNDTKTLIKRLYTQLQTFNKLKIKPVYIFDSNIPVKEKKECIEKRMENKKKQKNITLITSHDYEMVIKLLKLTNTPYIYPTDCAIEAEKFCAVLNKMGYVDFVITNDYDAIVFGAKTVFMKLSYNNTGQVINTQEFLKYYNITQKELVDMAIIMGTDYNMNGIYGWGVGKIIKYMESIDYTLDNYNFENKHSKTTLTLDKIKDIRKIFLENTVDINKYTKILDWSNQDLVNPDIEKFILNLI